MTFTNTRDVLNVDMGMNSGDLRNEKAPITGALVSTLTG